jgi:hypothetical protein
MKSFEVDELNDATLEATTDFFRVFLVADVREDDFFGVVVFILFMVPQVL